MMFKNGESKGDLNGFLDAGSHMDGELSFEDTFRVDGRLTGKVVSKGDLVVGERGEVSGAVEVGRVYVSGTVKASVKASKRIEITSGGRLIGDIEAPTLVIEEGGFYEGRCTMEPPKIAEKRATPPVAGVVTPLAAKREG